MNRKQVSYSFMSIVFLGNISELESLQASISQRGRLNIYKDSMVPRALLHRGFNQKKKNLESHLLDQHNSSKQIKTKTKSSKCDIPL